MPHTIWNRLKIFRFFFKIMFRHYIIYKFIYIVQGLRNRPVKNLKNPTRNWSVKYQTIMTENQNKLDGPTFCWIFFKMFLQVDSLDPGER